MQQVSKSTNHKSQTMTFWIRWSKLLLPKGSAKKAPSLQILIDVAEQPKIQRSVIRNSCNICGTSSGEKQNIFFSLFQQTSKQRQKYNRDYSEALG